MYLGPRPVVIICGTEAIREALVDQAEVFSGRAKIAVVDPVVQGHGKGLRATGKGQGWRIGIGEGEAGKGREGVERDPESP